MRVLQVIKELGGRLWRLPFEKVSERKREEEMDEPFEFVNGVEYTRERALALFLGVVQLVGKLAGLTIWYGFWDEYAWVMRDCFLF